MPSWRKHCKAALPIAHPHAYPVAHPAAQPPCCPPSQFTTRGANKGIALAFMGGVAYVVEAKVAHGPGDPPAGHHVSMHIFTYTPIRTHLHTLCVHTSAGKYLLHLHAGAGENRGRGDGKEESGEGDGETRWSVGQRGCRLCIYHGGKEHV